jgi:hypothetical protein
MTRPLPALLFDARRALHVSNQGALGELLGSSERSGQRWERGEALPTDEQLHRLAAMIFPSNGKLAAEIAAHTGTTLEQLGIVRPPPPPAPAPTPPPAPPPAPDPIHIVDTVVCAAAEAMQLMPDAIRPALRAAFRRARLAGLTVEAVDTALDGGSAAAVETTAPAKKGKGASAGAKRT